MWMHGGVGWGWMALGWVWMIAFWGSLIWLVAWGISKFERNRRTTEPSPLDIAKARYARGEINREQFEALKRDLA